MTQLMKNQPVPMTPPDPAEMRRLTRKALWRVATLAGFLGLVAFFDRLSIAFAGPQGMNEDLGLTATAFGFAVGIFTIGYVLFEIPTSGLMARVGVRRWIVRILIVWGIIQSLIAFVPNAPLLYIGRFLLGVAEAGFTPAIYFYISIWFVRSYRPLVYTIYGATISLSSIVGPLIATAIIGYGDGLVQGGWFDGWRLLLLLLGLLAVASAIPAWFGLVESPREAKWLTPLEQERYAAVLAADAEETNADRQSIGATIRDPRPWIIGFGFFCINYASYTITVWTPTIVLGFQEQFGTEFSPYVSAVIAGVPVLIAVVVGFLVAFAAGRTGQSGWLLCATSLVGAMGCLLSVYAQSPFFMVLALACVAIAGQGGGGLVMPMVTRVFAGAGAFSAIAIVNSLGAAASFVSPILTGFLIDLTGNTNAGFYFICVLLVVGAFLAHYMQNEARRSERSAPTFESMKL